MGGAGCVLHFNALERKLSFSFTFFTLAVSEPMIVYITTTLYCILRICMFDFEFWYIGIFRFIQICLRKSYCARVAYFSAIITLFCFLLWLMFCLIVKNLKISMLKRHITCFNVQTTIILLYYVWKLNEDWVVFRTTQRRLSCI